MENRILVNTTNSKKDIVKAGVATTTFQDCLGEVFKIIGVIIYEKEEQGETKTVTAVKRDDGEYVTSISPTILSSVETIRSAFDDEELEEGIEVVIKSKKSKGGRDFLYLDLV